MKFEMNNTKEVAVNKVSLFDEDGQEMSFTVSDTVMEQILQLCQTGKVKATGKVACKWAIEKKSVGKKNWFIVESGIYANRKLGKGNFDAKRKANALALALESKGGTKVELDAGTYKYFRIGFPTEAKAKAAISTLPEYIEG